MKKCVLTAIIGFLLLCPLYAAGADLSADQIMTHLETKYDVSGIHIRFHQFSPIKDMGMTDEAEGQLYIKQPDKMRWEYESPYKLFYITDGVSLWSWEPGNDPLLLDKDGTFLNDSNGGTFLSDISSIRKSFTVELAPSDEADRYRLKLTPIKPTADIKEIFLTVSKESFTILQVSTEYANDEIIYFTFESTEFGKQLNDSMFVLSTPKGADVLLMEE